ncbi:hypothetical protein [Tsukamurella spumae]|uniref:Uncharacterized protein n=1 Tax=Tsukamurella spumae TaxID=44753 RepID=A0A846X1Z3_9ACTN|nr:hypothetical protein [Tsukamurella spumae]NKY19627.1 hypothetical protein [Tsukamurella spumae]
MKKLLATTMIAGSIATGATVLGTGAVSAAPAYEWVRIGPYSSTWTCEQARDSYPANSRKCFTASNGKAYFYGIRQARR